MNNKKLLGLMAGVSSLVLAGSVSADFLGFDVEVINSGMNDDFTGVAIGTTYRIYAVMASGGEVDAIYGDSANPLSVSSQTSFYQHALGSYGAPMSALIFIYPALAYDSFVTIGRLTDQDNAMMDIGIDWTAFNAGGEIYTDNGTWFATPDDAQVHDPGDGRILIGQFTSDSFFATGTVSLQGKNADGSNWNALGVNWIPAPGALALLGLAGLASRRRRM